MPDCRRIALIGRCLVKKKGFDWYMPFEFKDFDWYMPIELGILIGLCLLKSVPLVFELASLFPVQQTTSGIGHRVK